jgi:hypothetical protein
MPDSWRIQSLFLFMFQKWRIDPDIATGGPAINLRFYPWRGNSTIQVCLQEIKIASFLNSIERSCAR